MFGVRVAVRAAFTYREVVGVARHLVKIVRFGPSSWGEGQGPK